MGDSLAHWQSFYSTHDPEEVSWYQSVPRRSVQMIKATGVGLDRPVIDIGCGTSTLVDSLLAHGYTDITLNDLSPLALDVTRQRLAARARHVRWIEGDASALDFGQQYALWHDRAVFHFLTDPDARRRYVEALHAALMPGGHLVMSTFAWDGPRKCSGLPASQYNAKTLCAELGDEFEMRDIALECHRTPGGTEQRFAWFRLQRRTAG